MAREPACGDPEAELVEADVAIHVWQTSVDGHVASPLAMTTQKAIQGLY